MRSSPHSPARIEVVVDEPDQLFERLDPTSGTDRHLAERVEQFILHQAEERRAREYALTVRARGDPIPPAEAAALAQAIGHHFAHRAAEEGAKTRALVHAGTRDLAIGLLFLFVCGAVALFAVRVVPAALGIFVEQGLLILGWVALWRPVDLFLYELRPLRQRRDLLNTLSTMEVRFEGGA